MRRFEKILIKLLLIHLFLLLMAQAFMHQDSVRPYLSKVVQYEGVGKMSINEWIETLTKPSQVE